MALATSVALFASSVFAAPVVKDGDVVAIIGDSITEGRTYSVLMEDYLLMCQPAKVRVMQAGWGGETVGGFNNRMADILAMKPTVATLSYGMNDGRYTKINDDIKNTYHAGLLKGVQALQQAGTRVIVGSPGCVDTNAFKGIFAPAADYNVNLAALRDEASAVAQTTGSPFADVYTPMYKAMEQGKAKYGRDYSIAGGDGIHPAYNGGLAMAYAYLKGLGFDGNVGTLYVDLAGHTAKTFGGHKFVKADGETFTFESTQYPMCFDTNPNNKDGAFKALEFVPFNAELNRLTLTAAGQAKKYKVTWGETSKEFTAEQLKAGVNLAAEFPDNPFSKPFMAAQQAIVDKQDVDRRLIKEFLHNLNAGRQLMAGHEAKIDAVVSEIPGVQAKFSTDVAARIAPVTHTITFQPID